MDALWLRRYSDGGKRFVFGLADIKGRYDFEYLNLDLLYFDDWLRGLYLLFRLRDRFLV